MCTFSGFVTLIHKQVMCLPCNTAPFTGSIPVVHGLRIISAIHSLALVPVPCSCKTEDLTAVGLGLLHLTRQLKLSQ